MSIKNPDLIDPDELIRTNREHDQRVGYVPGTREFTCLGRNPEYVPACPNRNATHEELWTWMRKMEERNL